MTEACPDDAPQGQRQPGVTVHTSHADRSTAAYVDRRITAGELSLNLALLVPAAARLDGVEGDDDDPRVVLRFSLPTSTP